jgi:hypothetical protein
LRWGPETRTTHWLVEGWVTQGRRAIVNVGWRDADRSVSDCPLAQMAEMRLTGQRGRRPDVGCLAFLGPQLGGPRQVGGFGGLPDPESGLAAGALAGRSISSQTGGHFVWGCAGAARVASNWIMALASL